MRRSRDAAAAAGSIPGECSPGHDRSGADHQLADAGQADPAATGIVEEPAHPVGIDGCADLGVEFDEEYLRGLGYQLEHTVGHLLSPEPDQHPGIPPRHSRGCPRSKSCELAVAQEPADNDECPGRHRLRIEGEQSARRRRRRVGKRRQVRNRAPVELSDRSLERLGLQRDAEPALIQWHADAAARGRADDLEAHVPQDHHTALPAWQPRDRQPRRQPQPLGQHVEQDVGIRHLHGQVIHSPDNPHVAVLWFGGRSPAG